MSAPPSYERLHSDSRWRLAEHESGRAPGAPANICWMCSNSTFSSDKFAGWSGGLL